MKKSKRTIHYLVVHCSATPEGRDHTAKDIDLWHRQRGFNEIGYNYVVHLDGTIEDGRDVDKIPAHVTNHNLLYWRYRQKHATAQRHPYGGTERSLKKAPHRA